MFRIAVCLAASTFAAGLQTAAAQASESSAADTQDEPAFRSYAGFAAGYAGGMEFEYDTPSGWASQQTSEVESGYVLEGVYGLAFRNGFRTEVALSYAVHNQAETTVPMGFIADGDGMKALKLAVLGYYDFAPQETVSPYVGAGIGVANIELDDGFIDSSGGGVHLQAVGGVAFAVTDNVRLFVEGRVQTLGLAIEVSSWTGSDETVAWAPSVSARGGLRVLF